jgi:pyruvate formate-lyase/glycerol dehydratase family glycyl radical enzyme
MLSAARVLSPQEERIEKGEDLIITTEEGRIKRARINRMLKGFRDKAPRLSVERARYFTESFRETEGLPLNLRWAMAMDNVMRKCPIFIGPEELIVGSAGPPGRYGLFYPELDGAYFGELSEIRPIEQKRIFILEEEDIQIIKEELLPYWKGRTFLEALSRILPEDTRKLLFKEGNIYSSAEILHQTATVRHSLQWSLDYEKVLTRGFNGIKKEAEERLAALDVYDPKQNFAKLPYYKAVIIICDAMIAFAERHAQMAREMASAETDPQRKRELLEIAEICEWVPANPARSFREAVQSQWFTQIGSRFEQLHGGVIGNGRIDQYLYPYYVKDKEAGCITDDDVLELLEHLWLNIAQCVRLQPTPDGYTIWEGYAHYEQTTIGGVTREGRDATNDLTYLILESKREFPLDFPDLSVRIHAGTPDPLLWAVCECIKEGTGFPKLFNDEEVIPILLAKGATLEEARDWCPNGCTEPRVINRNTYFSGTTWFNLAAVLEMALNGGKLRVYGDKQLGLNTGDLRGFRSFAEMWDAFRQQLEYVIAINLKQQYITDVLRPQKVAAPLLSALHDLCMEAGKDVSVGRIEGGLSLGGQTSVVGFGTVIDSLASIRKLVYEDKIVSMDEMLNALQVNFEGYEILRQRCRNAPKFGNGDEHVDGIGRDIEEIFLRAFEKHTNAYGGKPELMYVPITIHVPMGRTIGATPNGRKQAEPLSEGISPSQGADTQGPTVTLSSIAATKHTRYTQRAARLLNLKLSPQTVAGEEGTRKLVSLIRSWCDQKHWHIQLNIINRETLLAAQKEPEKYRNLLVRVAGYSAYFVDLSSALQNEIIARTEHSF